MKTVLSAIAAVATIVVVSAHQAPFRAEKRDAAFAAHGAHWDYGADAGGPSHWSLLDPAFVVCHDGHLQSPVNIDADTLASFVTCSKESMVISYDTLKDVEASWNGHTVEVDWDAASSKRNNSITIQGDTYNLVQFHFHTPSEHRINNRHADAEMHLVHRSPKTGAVAVVGVLLEVQFLPELMFSFITKLEEKVSDTFKLGSSNDAPPVDQVDAKEIDEGNEEEEDAEDEDAEEYDFDGDVDQEAIQLQARDLLESQNNGGKHRHDEDDVACNGLPPTSEDASFVKLNIKSFNFNRLFRRIGKFKPRWEYTGSLTTPPCTESVKWLVMRNSFPIGLSQLHALVKLQGYNAREIREHDAAAK